jgi:tripartite-type tricarboxylate transporter receptor subunit TctC
MTRPWIIGPWGQVGLLLLALLCARPVEASEPLRLLVGLPPGSATDQLTRILAEGLAERLDRPVTVLNRIGARGNIAAEEVARSAPDGGTLGAVTASTLVLNRHLSRQMGYDPQADLTPISRFASLPFLLLTGPRDGARSIGDLVDLLKGRPASCGTPGAGSVQHLALELLLRTLGARCDFVHYRGIGAAIPDLLDGSLQVYVEGAVIGLPLVREGRVRAIAVTSPSRLALLPETPTVAETVPGFEAETWIALMGPRGMAEPLVARFEAAAIAVARDPAVARRLRALAAKPVGGTRGELSAAIRAQDSIWGPVARAAGMTAD